MSEDDASLPGLTPMKIATGPNGSMNGVNGHSSIFDGAMSEDDMPLVSCLLLNIFQG